MGSALRVLCTFLYLDPFLGKHVTLDVNVHVTSMNEN
jgi:hypothetical protein